VLHSLARFIGFPCCSTDNLHNINKYALDVAFIDTCFVNQSPHQPIISVWLEFFTSPHIPDTVGSALVLYGCRPVGRIRYFMVWKMWTSAADTLPLPAQPRECKREPHRIEFSYQFVVDGALLLSILLGRLRSWELLFSCFPRSWTGIEVRRSKHVCQWQGSGLLMACVSGEADFELSRHVMGEVWRCWVF